ncbi:hypothetical protein [uncultured Thiodictyon sp.]|uniref:hypothetical protein n=1 Tax=uncultured Thiodictyon sp. TaxID=1846217 RepID=UPI0025E42570|nr:hypothetical protein [uncultured Thiodictyon sp.]
MALDTAVLRNLTKDSAKDAWRVIIDQAVEIASRPLTEGKAATEVTKRDREIGAFDHFLSSSAWDLWQVFGDPSLSGVERTADRLARWWAEPAFADGGAKAVLILDGLSLRELPWLLQGAQARGFTLYEVAATASELPGETNAFAQALGLGSRSQLQNNGGGSNHRLAPSHTECVDLPWRDCAGLINSQPNWVFWHHWPDSKVHDGSGAGQGLDTLTRDAALQLTSDDFWFFVERLAQGRRLVISSDHGYAATGYFPDADGEVGQFLKATFASGRSMAGTGDTGPFVPPVALQIDSPHGPHLLALGRRKWKSQGGYPTLTHGGLSLMEVLSPFVELSRADG